MFDYLVAGGRLIRNGRVENGHAAVADGRITVITGTPPPPAREVVNAAGLYVCPGFIDLHVHGGAGSDVLDGSVRAVQNMAAFHARHGTTGILPTIAAAPLPRVAGALRAVARAGRKGGSRLLGVHLEGPYLNPAYKGAQNEEFLHRPAPADLEQLVATTGGLLRLMSLAPELPGAPAAVRMLSSRGVTVAAGHSGATLAETAAAVRCGLSHVTHVFNAMRPFHHREPGLAGAALAFPDLSVEVIADGLHVDPLVLKLLWRLAGDRLVLVTDAVAPAGMPDGRYRFADQDITLDRGRTRLPDGTLAGSTLTMDRAVKNMIDLAGLSLPEAVALATASPARVLGIDRRKGRLDDGYDADILLVDESLRPRLVMVEGEIVYRVNPPGPAG